MAALGRRETIKHNNEKNDVFSLGVSIVEAASFVNTASCYSFETY